MPLQAGARPAPAACRPSTPHLPPRTRVVASGIIPDAWLGRKKKAGECGGCGAVSEKRERAASPPSASTAREKECCARLSVCSPPPIGARRLPHRWSGEGPQGLGPRVLGGPGVHVHGQRSLTQERSSLSQATPPRPPPPPQPRPPAGRMMPPPPRTAPRPRSLNPPSRPGPRTRPPWKPGARRRPRARAAAAPRATRWAA